MLYNINAISVMLRILSALVIGGILGIERGRKQHPAGFRTYMLVCLGSALVMMTNQYIAEQYGGGDLARLGAQVISGIGFLGAGTIIVTRRNQVKGLTTAAGLWAAACLGLAIGIGFYMGALLVGFAVFLIMTVFQKFDNWVTGNARYMNLYLSFESMKCFNEFMDFCDTIDIEVQDIELSKSKIPKESGIFVIMILENKKRAHHSEIIKKISGFDGLKHVEEL